MPESVTFRDKGGNDPDALYYQVDLLKTLNEKLTDSIGVFDQFINMSGNAYAYYNFKNDYFEAVGNFEALFGMPASRRTDAELLVEYAMEEYRDALRELLKVEDQPGGEAKLEFCIEESHKWLEGHSLAIFDTDGSVVEKYVCFHDITRFKLQHDELSYLAYYDDLTGLLNRNFFIQKLNLLVQKAQEENVKVSVAMLDIDSFKRINDSIGLILGDELLQHVGQFLLSLNTENTIVGRFGTDVFVAAIYNPSGSDTIENLLDTIRRRLTKPFILSNKDEIYLTMTIGVASFPEASGSGFDVLQKTEICIYAAKDGNKGGVKYYDNELMRQFVANFALEKRLQDAIVASHFMLYYQPQYNVRTGKLRGCEALIRWRDEDGRFISPADFIPIAEKSGGIITIGKWVISTALQNYQIWQRLYGFDGILSINISAIQLKKDNFIDELLDYMRREQVNPENIEIEITESVFIDNFHDIIEKMKSMQQFGLRVSLDDFGTGFSSLSYLKNLPINTLKIDKSFIDTVITDDATGIITESIVSMVRRLGLETIAEGVEDERQMEFLKKIDCDNIQGFLLGKPMPEEEFEALIAADRQS
ncbi:MAG: EAL domain-containing protein [Lachnospiraceae bacterium]|nr:EAL domain-containing protein [Lachnospiraceae bacterium]